MARGLWRRELYRLLFRSVRRTTGREGRPRILRQGRGKGRSFSPVLLTLLVGTGLALFSIQLLEARLQPTLAAAAQAQTKNTVTAALGQAVTEELARRQLSYADLATIQRDEGGAITAITTDMASMNLLRSELVSAVLEAVEGLDISCIQIPLGSLFGSELLWARGPAIQARAMRVGTVTADFQSEFTSAGVNQTLHRIFLELSAPMTVLLPGGPVEVPVDARLCVAETVIVGQVPDTYLRLDNSGMQS